MSNSSYSYKLGGTLEAEAPSYVQRQADEDFYKGLKSGEFCYVLNARQMGKSSLQVRTRQRLKADGVRCAVIDITEIGTAEITPEQWYAGMINGLVDSFSLYDRFDLDDWWSSLPLLSPVQRFGKFLESVLLLEILEPIVIFVDEIDSVRSLPFNADDFFAVIRNGYNKRATDLNYRRLTFALIGAATPIDLIRDPLRTPFNVGRSIELAGFQLADTKPLQLGLGEYRDAIGEILAWTGGQPFLTQKLCALVMKRPPNPQFWGDRAREDFVARVVREGITENWEGKDDPVHLKTIRGRVLEVGEAQAGRLLGLYQRVLEEESLAADDSPEQMQLRLSGLVMKRDGRLWVFNRIYREVFDRSWVAAELAKLRPAYYGVAISEWLESGDESRLLRGEVLQNAIEWSEGKQLSDEDSRFLRVSQEAENRSEKEANQILATARHQAETELEAANVQLAGVNRQIRRRTAIGGTVLAASLVLAGLAIGGAVMANYQKVDAETKKIAAEQNAKTAETKKIAAEQNAKTAETKATAAEARRETILKASSLERAGITALTRSKFEQIHGLVDAMKAGEDTLAFKKEKGDEGFTVSLIYPLQSILDVVENRSLQPWNDSAKSQQGSAPLNQTLLAHEKGVRTAQFSPDGQRIVTASWDKTSRVWDAKTGREIAALKGHKFSVRTAQFSPDGQRIVTASDDNTSRVWDAKTGQKIAVLKGHEKSVTTAQFSPDGQRIVTTSVDHTSRVWDAKTGQEIAVLKGHKDTVNTAQFSPDGQRIVTASSDNTSRVWDSKTGQNIAAFKGHKYSVYTAQFSPDGQHVVTASWDRTSRMWDAKTGREIAALRGHEDRVKTAQFSPDGQRIVTASADNTSRVWDAKTGQEIAALNGHESSVNTAQFSPDGQRIVTASDDNTSRVWDAKTGQEIAALRGHESYVKTAQFSPDGQRIVTASDDKTSRVWDAKTGQEIATLRGHKNVVKTAQFSPDGQRIVTASDDKTSRVWNAKIGQEIALLKGHKSYVKTARFSPDGQRIVTASDDKTSRVWDANTGKEIAALKGHESSVYIAQFSPDGQRIVTASDDKTSRVWDANTGKEIAALKGHGNTVNTAQFSPDGQRIVTASWDRTSRVWDAKTGQEISSLKGHEDIVWTAQFSPDGQRIVTASNDKTSRVWPVENLDILLDRGCRWLRNYLIVNPQTLMQLQKCQTLAIAQAALPNLIRQSETQARNGKITQAIEGFTIAKKWDPSLTFDPVAKANELAKEKAKSKKRI